MMPWQEQRPLALSRRQQVSVPEMAAWAQVQLLTSSFVIPIQIGASRSAEELRIKPILVTPPYLMGLTFAGTWIAKEL